MPRPRGKPIRVIPKDPGFWKKKKISPRADALNRETGSLYGLECLTTTAERLAFGPSGP